MFDDEDPLGFAKGCMWALAITAVGVVVALFLINLLVSVATW